MKNIHYKHQVTIDLFFDISENNFQEKIRFYDKHALEILDLEFDDRIKILIEYSIALYKVGEYQSFLRQANKIIPTIISENIYEHKGEDIFKTLLYFKASACLSLDELDTSIHICRELIRMDKEKDEYKKLYVKTVTQKLRKRTLKAMAIGVSLFIITAIVTAICVLIIKPFYFQWYNASILLRDVLFIAGVMILIGSELYVWHKAKKEVKKLL